MSRPKACQMDRTTLLREIKTRLERAPGDRLAAVVLYGSEARGEARADSDIDIDLLVVVRPFFDIRASVEAVVPLAIDSGRLIHPTVTSDSTLELSDFPKRPPAAARRLVIDRRSD